jgi:pimeloyl-ACP methyl ester carboxylesterase
MKEEGMDEGTAIVSETERIKYAISADGTRIGWTTYGQGPPLMLVSGVSADRTQWQGVIPILAHHFTVCAVDRRGRGVSEDGPVYSLQREFEDIAAVATAVGEDAAVLGHSHGGCCALGAATLTEKIAQLVVYEGWPPRPVRSSEAEVLQALDKLLEEDRREDLLVQFFQEIVGLLPHQIEATRAHPAWSGRLKAAHTISRELRATNGFNFSDEALRAVRASTLLLVGGENLAWLQPSIDRLSALIPKLHVAVMPGQGHIAMNTAPEVFCAEVTAFLARA